MKQMSFLDFEKVREDRNMRLIDVREQDEWDEVHAKGAELWALSKIRNGELPPSDDRDTAIICRSGGRSAMASQILESNGWDELTNISDGTNGAIAAGDDYVERG